MNEDNKDKKLTQIRVENDKDITSKPEEGTKIKAKDGKTYMVAKDAEVGWFYSSIVAVEQDKFDNKVLLVTGWSYWFRELIATRELATIGLGVWFFKSNKKRKEMEEKELKAL